MTANQIRAYGNPLLMVMTVNNLYGRLRWRSSLLVAYCICCLLNGPLSPGAENMALSATSQTSAKGPQTTGLSVETPDGRHLATVFSGGRIEYRRAGDSKVERTFYHCAPRAMAFSGDGRLLACAGSAFADGFQLKVWSVTDRDIGLELRVPGEVVEAVAVGQYAAVISTPSQLCCVSLQTRTIAWTVSKAAGTCELKFSEDDERVLLSLVDGSLTEYSALTGRKVKRASEAPRHQEEAVQLK